MNNTNTHMEQKSDNGQSPLHWNSRIELKWIDFLKNDKDLKRNSGILQHKTAIAFIRKFMTTPREDINVANTQTALLEAIEQYGINNKIAFTKLKDCVESYSKIQLVNSRLLTVSDYNYKKTITSIGQANKRLIEALDLRGFVPEKDKELLKELLQEGEKWRNDWHHDTPPNTDIEKLTGGCKAWLNYIFAVAAICFHYNKSRGGILFTADRDCLLTFTQPEANPGKQSTFNTLKGIPFQIDARPGGFHLEITVTEANGRSRMETRTGEIKRDEYFEINIRVGELGRGGVPRFAANPLLAGMAKPANDEGIPFQGGTYRGQTNERKLPHGIGTFIRNGISYGGRFREGKPEGSFLVKGEGFEYRGTLNFGMMPWGLDKGEMTLTLANGQRYTYKEATFRGMHCLRGSFFLDGKLLYKGNFAPPTEGMIPLLCGNGELHSADGSIYYGEVDNNLPHGRGCLVSDSSTKAIYTDWIAGESTESIDTMRKIILSGDRPAWLFDSDRIVCPVSGAPLTFYYIGLPHLTLRDESGATLTCPDTEEWKYRFGSPTTQPKPEPRPAAQTRPEPKPTVEQEKQANPTAQPRPAQTNSERKEPRQPAKEKKEPELTQKKGENGKYGFVDERGVWKIYPQYDEVDVFSEGLARIKMKGQYGYINKQGNMVIQPHYDYVELFSNGKARVRLNGEIFYIDKQGNRVDDPGKPASPQKPGQGIAIGCKQNERNYYYPVDKYGNQVGTVESMDYITFHEDLACVKIWFKNPNNLFDGHGMYGFINRKGELAIPAKFTSAHYFQDGVAPVAVGPPGKMLWGIIDKSGDWVLEPNKYNYIGFFENGKARARTTEGKWVTLTLTRE